MSNAVPILIGGIVFTLVGFVALRYPQFITRHRLEMTYWMSDETYKQLIVLQGWIFVAVGGSILAFLLIYSIAIIVRSAVGI